MTFSNLFAGACDHVIKLNTEIGAEAMCATSGLCLEENVNCISSLSSAHWQTRDLRVGAGTTSEVEAHFKFDKEIKLSDAVRKCNMTDCIGLYLGQIHHSIEATMTFPLL